MTERRGTGGVGAPSGDPGHPRSEAGASAGPRPDTDTPRPAPTAWWRRPRWWILTGTVVALAFAQEGSLDAGAQAATDRVFRQALLTYAAARSLDAAVSLAEGTELSLEPGGVGLTVSAGEVLEPLDDLVEQFSSLMLVSTTSLGVQSLLLRASAWGPLTLLLVLFLVARVATAFLGDRVPATLARLVSTGAVVLLLARFALPLYAVGTTWLFESYLEPGQVEAVQALEETSTDVRELDQLDEAQPRPGLVGRVSDWFSRAVNQLDVSERVEALRARVGEVVDQLLHLLVVFVLQTIVFPVAFLWMMARALTAATSRVR